MFDRRRLNKAVVLSCLLFASVPAVHGGENENDSSDDKPMSASTFSGLKLRSIGPHANPAALGLPDRSLGEPL